MQRQRREAWLEVEYMWPMWWRRSRHPSYPNPSRRLPDADDLSHLPRGWTGGGGSIVNSRSRVVFRRSFSVIFSGCWLRAETIPLYSRECFVVMCVNLCMCVDMYICMYACMYMVCMYVIICKLRITALSYITLSSDR